MNIPALIGISVPEEWDGKLAAVDGHTGMLYIDPDEETLAMLHKKQEEADQARALLQEVKGRETITRNGKKISSVRQHRKHRRPGKCTCKRRGGHRAVPDRTLYLESDHYPTEQEQFQAYQTVAETMAGKSDYPDPGHRADKQVGLLQSRERRKSRDGLPGDSDLPRPEGYLQDAAPGHPARLRVWHTCNHVSDDHLPSGNHRSKKILAEVKQELSEEGIPVRTSRPAS